MSFGSTSRSDTPSNKTSGAEQRHEPSPALGGEDEVKDEMIWDQNIYGYSTDMVEQIFTEQKAVHKDEA